MSDRVSPVPSTTQARREVMKREAELQRAQAKLDGFSPAKKPKPARRPPLQTPELALVGRRIKLGGFPCQVLTYLPSTCQVHAPLPSWEVCCVVVDEVMRGRCGWPHAVPCSGWPHAKPCWGLSQGAVVMNNAAC